MVTGVEIRLGEEDPKPTTFCWLSTDVLAPDRIEEVLRTFEPRGESSEFKERLEPARELGLEPPLLPGIPDCLRIPDILCSWSSLYLRIEAASPASIDCLGIGKLRSDFSLIWKWINLLYVFVCLVIMCISCYSSRCHCYQDVDTMQ